MGMRVAICVLSLLGIGCSQAGFAQALQASDASAFTGAVPVLALNSSGLNTASLGGTKSVVPESVPSVKRVASRQGERHVPMKHAVVAMGMAAAPGNALQVGASPRRKAGSSGAVLPPSSDALRSVLPGMRVQPPPVRSVGDHVLAGLVAIMLIAYQLRRKHRVLRPHPFTN